jgi:hypothetical protein
MWDSIADKSNRKRKEKKITVISERKANGHGRSGRHMRKPGTFSKTAFQNRLLTKTTEMPHFVFCLQVKILPGRTSDAACEYTMYRHSINCVVVVPWLKLDSDKIPDIAIPDC